MTERIKQAIFSLQALPKDEWETFSAQFRQVRFLKNDYIIREGNIAHDIYFLESGATRNFFLKDGKEYTVDFHFAGEFVAPFYSLITKGPSPVFIQSLFDTETIAVSYTVLEAYYQKSLAGANIGRMIAERQYIRRLQREMDMLSLTAEERYARLLHRNPDLVATISVKHLSSYLGIQPESLSRIRRQYQKS